MNFPSSYRALILCAVVPFIFGACSGKNSWLIPSSDSFVTKEAGLGALGGGALGAGIGYAIGEANGNVGPNVAINAGIGVGAGLVAGAMVHEYAKEQKAEVQSREDQILRNQEKIDRLRARYNDSVGIGRDEPASWKERYWDYNANLPYQGPTSSY